MTSATPLLRRGRGRVPASSPLARGWRGLPMSGATGKDILRDNPIFAPASDRSLQRLLEACEVKTFAPREMIITAGEPALHVYALGRGLVRIFHTSPQGAEVVVKLFGGPCFFGESEAFAHIDWLISGQAVEPSDIVLMPRAAVLSFLRGEAECAVRMLIDVGNRLAVASYHERSLAFDPSTVRLASYLVDYATWTNPAEAKQWKLELTQDAMAAAVGVTRRSVAKDIAAWQDEAIITRRGRSYVVLEPARLRDYADAERLALSYRLRSSWVAHLFGDED